MVEIKCKICGHEVVNFENFVQLKDGSNMCEVCFFDMSIKEMGAKEVQLIFNDVVESEDVN